MVSNRQAVDRVEPMPHVILGRKVKANVAYVKFVQVSQENSSFKIRAQVLCSSN